MSVQETRIALRNLGKINPESIDDYISVGGYEALTKAREMNQDELISEIENASKLRGRGGAGFNTGFKWSGAKAKEKGIVDFSMNAREIYRTFKRTGVDLTRMQPVDALKFDVDPEYIFCKVTGPVSFNYEAEPEILKIDGKSIAIAHNLGQARKLLEGVKSGTNRFDVIRLCA